MSRTEAIQIVAALAITIAVVVYLAYIAATTPADDTDDFEPDDLLANDLAVVADLARVRAVRFIGAPCNDVCDVCLALQKAGDFVIVNERKEA